MPARKLGRPRKSPRSRRRLTFTHRTDEALTVSDNVSQYLDVIANVQKRKLPEAIVSDDEEPEDQNSEKSSECVRAVPLVRPRKLGRPRTSLRSRRELICTQRTDEALTISGKMSRYSDVIANVPKRKLPVAIISDDEEAEDENSGTSSAFTSLQVTSPSKVRVLGNIIVNSSEKNDPISSNVKKSPTKDSATKENVKDEKKKVNYEQLKVIREFFVNVLKSAYLSSLLNLEDREFLKKFFNVKRDHQYACVKLFLWKPIWYNIFKLVEKLGLPFSENEVITLYNSLKDNKLVETDYMQEEVYDLLNLLTLKDVRDIGRSFKFPGVRGTKASIIEKLLTTCRTQSTLKFFTKADVEDVLKKRIKEKMGFCVKLSAQFYNLLYSVYLLNTFTNPSLIDPQDYFTNVTYFNAVFPTSQVENFHIFYTPFEFAKYVEATKLRMELEKAIKQKNLINILGVVSFAFHTLKTLNTEFGDTFDSSREGHLEKFTPNAQYVAIISEGAKHITTSYPEQVASWYEYLISQGYSKHRRGEWYCNLALVYTVQIKNYSKAAKIVIQGFNKEKDHLTDIQLQELAYRGKMLNKASYHLSTLLHDELVSNFPPSCDRDWPKDIIDCNSMQCDEPVRKRMYACRNDNGDTEYLTVEQLALKYYKGMGYTNGLHCEGSLIIACFCLLFWDIIYDTYVKGAFVSNLQNAPLDMYTKHFYTHREKQIRKRLKQISVKWDENEVKKIIFRNWELHSHENSLCQIDAVVDNPGQVYDVIMCIGRPVLGKIFERLVINFRIYKSGFPDLIVWNSDEKKAKFVEVKSENDKLSIKQKLWLNYLIDAGASVAVCHVEPKASKKKLK